MKKTIIAGIFITCIVAAVAFFLTREPDMAPYTFKSNDILIDADIITPAQEIRNGSVVVRGERIIYAGSRLRPSGDITVIEHPGRVYPGLVNAHDHLGYDLFPKWDPETVYTNRTQWKESDEDEAMMADLYAIRNEDRSVVNGFVELRKIIAGTTSVQSSHYWRDPDILARNLNDPDEVDGRELYNDIFVDQTAERRVREQDKIRDGQVAYCVHVAEGTDAAAHDEFEFIREENLIGPTTLLIHGIPLTEDDFAFIKEHGASLGWSPKCNWLLYEATADVVTADEIGVNIVLTTDWTRQGSATLLDEMSYVSALDDDLYNDHFDAEDIFRMGTVNAAEALGMGDLIGSIKPGTFADLVLVAGSDGDPFTSFIGMDKSAIVLVLVNGEPVYGTEAYLNQFDGDFYDVSVFGETRGSVLDLSATQRKLRRICPTHLPLIIEETPWGGAPQAQR